LAHDGLIVRGLTAGYGRATVLHGIDLDVEPGRHVAVLGPNGAGKTTMLRAVSGIAEVRSGTIEFAGESLVGAATHEIVRRGVVHVPEGRHVFPEFTVAENLRVAAYARGGGDISEDVDRVVDAFPALRARYGVRAGFLSGGEQQMLAIGRAVVQRPRLLLLDEMSLGLAPIVIKEIYAKLDSLFADTATVIVEQNPSLALEHAEAVYVLRNGEIGVSGSVSQFESHEALMEAYVGTGELLLEEAPE
jgi:branched-chain amino acid transport system ATP-binding protein